ncbi:MAG TPA: hypothetical protein VN660_13120 [Steroidobacteraceae bacterium]|nr:hypothetical protein [Steroidobacteraceae bacterium]
MPKQMRPGGGAWLGDYSQRGDSRARGRVALVAVLGITAGFALLEAPPVRAAAPTCEEPPLPSPVLQKQFADIAPGVPYQAGVPPVKDGERPKGDAAILRLVEDQMGFIRGDGRSETLHAINRMNFSGCGEVVEDGHTYEVTHYSYGMGLHDNAAREEIEGEGPGGKVHLIRVVRGNEAWDESTPGVGTHSADKLVRQRQLQLGRMPFGILNTIVNLTAKWPALWGAPPPALANTYAPQRIKIHDSGHGPVTLELPVDGVSMKVVLDRNYRPATVTQRVDHHLIVDKYSDYHDVNQYGVMIPRHIVETIDGHPHLSLHIVHSEMSDYEVFPAPSFEAPFPPPLQSADYEFIGGGFGVPQVRAPMGTTPRGADGHPELAGFWGQPRGNFGGAGRNETQFNYPARHGIFSNFENDYFITGQQGDNIPLYQPQYWSQIHDNQAHAATSDPYLQCDPVPPPRLGPPVRIVETSRDFLFFANGAVGTPNTYRDIPKGPVFRKPDRDGTQQGTPASQWDGDTLVVDTVGFDGTAWLSRAGYPTGYNLETIERLQRQGDRLSYDVTVKDPDYLQRPWTLPTEYVYALPDDHRFVERGGPYMCVSPGIPEVGATLG